MDIKYITSIISLGIITSLIPSCALKPPSVEGYTAYRKAAPLIKQDISNNKKLLRKKNNKLPDSFQSSMLEFRRFGQSSRKQAPPELKMKIKVSRAPAQEFYMGLVKGTDYSMVVSPEIQGSITLDLKDVSIMDVLDTMERVYGFQYYYNDTGFEILPNKIDTRIFSVNYLDLKRSGSSSVEMTTSGISDGNNRGGRRSSNSNNNNNDGSGGVSSSSKVSTTSSIDFWKKLESTLKSIVGTKNGKNVVVNPQSGVIVVSAYPKKLRVVAEYLDQVQKHMSRQVIIEAKIIEITLNDQYKLGIDWRAFGQNINTFQDIVGTASDAFTFKQGLGTKDFKATIKALSTQGTLQVLSSPRVSTLNNQKAVIKAGDDRYFVTDISTGLFNNINNTISTASDINLEPFFSGISLDVTPYIDKYDQITLHVRPAVSEITEEDKIIENGNAGNIKIPLAKSSIRETDTVIKAGNKEVVVLAGLMKDRTQEVIDGLPFVEDIPFIGKLFRKTHQKSDKTELVILLKATIIEPKTWINDMRRTNNRFDSLDDGFHFGNRPDRYGTEAETFVRNWPIDEEFLECIVIRDDLISSGKDPDKYVGKCKT